MLHNYHADGGGNITALLNNNSSSASVSGTYRYDAFGRTLATSGSIASANVYRFSSKPVQPNSGLYDYGFRFYDPSLQRWINRDPILEAGGINVYGFVLNTPTDLIDPLGLTDNSVNAACRNNPKALVDELKYTREASKYYDDLAHRVKSARKALRSKTPSKDLRRALGDVPEGMSANHNIPWGLRNHPAVRKAADAGWNINTKNNGTALPGKLHDGWRNWHDWHKAYNEFAKKQLDNLWKRSKDRSPAEIAEDLQALADRLGQLAQQCVGQ